MRAVTAERGSRVRATGGGRVTADGAAGGNEEKPRDRERSERPNESGARATNERARDRSGGHARHGTATATGCVCTRERVPARNMAGSPFSAASAPVR